MSMWDAPTGAEGHCGPIRKTGGHCGLLRRDRGAAGWKLGRREAMA